MAAPGGGQPADPASMAALLHPVLEETAATAPTLVISPPPVAAAEANARIAQLCKLQQMLCDQRGIPFAQVHELLITNSVYMDDLSDGLHPGSQGCAQMAQTLLAQQCVREFMRAAQ
jgi:hypothetical protein